MSLLSRIVAPLPTAVANIFSPENRSQRLQDRVARQQQRTAIQNERNLTRASRKDVRTISNVERSIIEEQKIVNWQQNKAEQLANNDTFMRENTLGATMDRLQNYKTQLSSRGAEIVAEQTTKTANNIFKRFLMPALLIVGLVLAGFFIFKKSGVGK